MSLKTMPGLREVGDVADAGPSRPRAVELGVGHRRFFPPRLARLRWAAPPRSPAAAPVAAASGGRGRRRRRPLRPVVGLAARPSSTPRRLGRRRTRPPPGAPTGAVALAAGPPAGDPLGQRLHRRLALLELREQRRRDEDRGVRAGRDADEQRQRQVLERARRRAARRRRTRIAATGSSAMIEVLIDRTRVWLTARLAASAVGHPAAAGEPAGVLPDLVEHDDGVVQRVAEDRQDADDRRRRDLEADQGVDADRDDQVVDQRDQRRDRHPPLEVERQEDHDEDQEEQQAAQRLAR